jgi:hypothetical protein
MWLLSRLIKDFERVSKAEARHTEPATAKWCPIICRFGQGSSQTYNFLTTNILIVYLYFIKKY